MRPHRLVDPVRRIVQDELRRLRLSRAQFIGVGASPQDDAPGAVTIEYDGQGRVVAATTPDGRVLLDWSDDGTLVRVTEERKDGRDVVWEFARDASGHVVAATPTVYEHVVEEVSIG